MTAAAQVMTSGIAAPSSSRTQSSSRADRSDTSFRDTLDSASNSSSTSRKDSARSSRSEKDAGASSDNAANEASAEAPNATEAKSEAGGLSLLLQVLASGSRGEDAPNNLVPASEPESGFASLGTGIPTDAEDAGILLPGMVDDAEPAFDAGRLMEMLRSSGDTARRPADVSSNTPFVVTVTGQETHLALGDAQQDLTVKIAQAQNSAETAGMLAGDSAAAPEQATARLAEAALEQRLGNDTPGAPQDAGGSRRSAPVAVLPADGQDSSGALADQGVAGQEGRQQDGRGSGSGSPQGNAAFATNLQGLNSARDAGAGVAAHEPMSEQIAAGVRAELRAGGLGESSSEGVVKVLKIELKPANLGAVTVRMELKDNVITLHLETQNRETLAVIEREREALTSALTRAGYSVEGITATPQSEAGRSSLLQPQQGMGDANAAFQGAPGQGGQESAQSSSGQSGHRGASGQQDQSTPGQTKDDGSRSDRRGGDGLYV